MSRMFSRALACLSLVLLLASSASLYADETYLISEEELTRLMTTLEEAQTALTEQKTLTEELQASLRKEQELSVSLKTNYEDLLSQQTLLQGELTNSQNDLKKANESLIELRSEVGASMNRQMWIGIGIGALVGILLGGGIATAITLSV